MTSAPNHTIARAALTALAALLATGLLAGASATPASASATPTSVVKLCNAANPHPFSKTYDIRFGTKTVYNRDLSRSLVCSGSFGAPDGYKATFAAACDLAMAAFGVIDPTESAFKTWGCAIPKIHEKGWVRGSFDAGVSAACGYVADAVGVGVGVFAAGETLDPAIGVATYKGVAFVGDTIVCIGIGKVVKDAKSWGIRLESNHEVAVARDIETAGRCLQMTKRKIIGIQWSAVPCPSGFGGTRLPKLSNTTPGGDGGTDEGTGTTVIGDDGTVTDTTTGVTEIPGGPTNTWTDPVSAGGTQGPTIASGQSVQIACKLTGFRVANGNTWWYRIASSPWSGSYYASADAFYNNGASSGSLQGTPFVDPAVPDCASGAGPAPEPVSGTSETTGGAAHTWSDPQSAGGAAGPVLAGNQTVQIACKLQGFRVADGNTWWYRVASSPWSGGYYVSADAFYNNGSTSGSLHGTPFVDPAVGDC
jgi:hypothetical protein